METTYYSLNAREIIVSGDGVEQVSGGGARQLVCMRRSAALPRREAQGKVIDLAAWRQARQEEEQEEWYDEPEEAAAQPQPRARRDHSRTALVSAELLASLSVVGVMALLLLRVLGA